MESPKYSIVIPAYNEAERLSESLDKILAFIEQQHWSAEVVVVNDGSRDNTAELVHQYSLQHSSVRLVENPGNRGKGYTVRHGVMSAFGKYIMFTDADLSSPIHEATKLFAPLESGEAKITIGSRWKDSALQTERQPLKRQILGRCFNLALRVTLGLGYRDTQCGFKAFTREAAEVIFPMMQVDRWGFDPEILFLAKRLRFPVMEVPVEWAHDSRSKIKPVQDGIRMLGDMIKVRMNSVSGKYSLPPGAATTRYATPF